MHIVRVELTEENRNKVKELRKKDWLSLINDSTTDWAAKYCMIYIEKTQPYFGRVIIGRDIIGFILIRKMMLGIGKRI